MQNVGGIGFVSNQRSLETLKMEKLKKTVIEHSVDLLALIETNKDWRCVPTNNTIWEARKGWKEHRRI